MKYREVILDQLKKQPYFNKEAFSQLAKGYHIKDSTINSYITRSLKHKDILQLRRGLYVTTDFYTEYKSDTSYLFYLANILRGPSYISSWSALQYYNLATEVIHSITSITEKVTRDYETKIGTFSYHSINKKIFSNFSLVKGNFEFFIATPAKALFDLLYFKTNQLRGVSLDQINHLIVDLRIDIDEMEEKERATFYEMIQKYIAHE